MAINDAETIAELARQATPAHIIKTAENREFLVYPGDYSEKEVTDAHGLFLDFPRYIKQAVTLETVDSLVDYVNRFKGDDSVLFATIVSNVIAGLIDYHVAAEDAVDGTPARHAAHRATMTLPFSEEWKLWTSIHGKLMSQLDFARFVEENAADITAPIGGELLDAVRDLQVHRKVNFIKAVRTASDTENFEYSVEENATTKRGSIELPTKFRLDIPVYFGEPATELYAFLRWKMDPEAGGLSLGVALHRAEHVRQAVFKQIVLTVSDRTNCPVVFGKPS